MSEPRARSGTVIDVLGKAESFLASHGCATPRLDAGLLLAHVLNTERVQLYVDHARPLDPDELDAFRELTKRRAVCEPVAYLTGTREFWSLSFQVDRRVLIPRPDTETLLEEVLELFDPADETQALRFADVGTGSGCLACSLASLYPGARVLAIDRDEQALAVARVNLEHHGLQSRVELRLGDMLEPLGDERVDLICANLPYIPTGDLNSLSDDIRLHEPLCALDGGPDGLDPIRRLVVQAPDRLSPGGWLTMEVGIGQAEPVMNLCQQADLTQIHTRNDLSGTARVVAAKTGSGNTT